MARKLLKEFRTSISLTQEQMAEKLEITLSHYKQIECGFKNPSLKTLKKFKGEFPTANIVDIFLT